MPRSISEILDDPADGPVVKAYLQVASDKRVTGALATYALNHPSDETLTPRLAALEAAAEAQVAAMKLENYVLRRSQALGINPEDIEDLGMTFKDAADVDAKLGKLGEKVKKRDLEEVNEKLAGSFKPGSGNSGVAGRYDSFSPADRAALEKRR
jgi:hypothetical protein